MILLKRKHANANVLIRCCGEREGGRMVDNGLHQTMLFHSPCYRETIDHRQGNFSPQIQLSRIKVYQCLPGNPLLAVFVPDFDFRPYSGWCGLPYSAALGFLLGLGSSLIRGQHLSPSGAHNYRHQKLSPAPLHCTELEQPFEMRALAKEIKEGLPTPPQSPSP